MLALSIILFLTYKLTISINEGDCIPINQCPQIFNLFLQNNFSNSTATFLRQSKCGFINGIYPKVCCPLEFPSNITTRLLPDHSDCGESLGLRIFGGNKTDIYEFPWMALLEYKDANGRSSFQCGGVLINRRYVLTARHCLKQTLKQVRLGEWNTTSDPDCIKNDCAPKFLAVPIQEQISYVDKTNLQNDIGLLRLSQEVEYTEFIRPICLPTTSDLLSKSYIGKKLVVAGWGMTEDSKKNSEVKRKVTVPVKPLFECGPAIKRYLRVDYRLHDGMLCAGGETGEDSCTGDSGGPLMHYSNKWYAIGIVSFGPTNPCGQTDSPGVYVRISKYMKWIVDNIKP